MGLDSFPKRGEIYLVSLDPTVGAEINKTRPALVISNDINNQFSRTVTVIPITSNVKKVYPFEVAISSAESGLLKNSKAKCDQIRTVDKKRVLKSIGKASPRTLKAAEKALFIHIGFVSKRR